MPQREFRFSELKFDSAHRANLEQERGKSHVAAYEALLEALKLVPVASETPPDRVKPEHAKDVAGLSLAAILDHPGLSAEALKAVKDYTKRVTSPAQSRHAYRLLLAKAVIEHGAERTTEGERGFFRRLFGMKPALGKGPLTSHDRAELRTVLYDYARESHLPKEVADYVDAAVKLLG